MNINVNKRSFEQIAKNLGYKINMPDNTKLLSCYDYQGEEILFPGSSQIGGQTDFTKLEIEDIIDGPCILWGWAETTKMMVAIRMKSIDAGLLQVFGEELAKDNNLELSEITT